MGSLVVIHGTGVRVAAYEDTFEVVERKLRLARPHIVAMKCLWGDGYGARLPESPLCLPMDSDRGDGMIAEDLDLQFWAQLYEDPLVELRELGSRPGGGDWPVAELLAEFKSAEPSAKLIEALRDLNMTAAWSKARSEIMESTPLKQAVARVPESTIELRRALARAIVAHLTAAALHGGSPVPDDELRETLVNEMVSIFRPVGENDPDGNIDSRGLEEVRKKIKGSMFYGLQWLSAGFAERKRLTEAPQIAPVAGDIILYQSPQGNAIREFVANTLRKSPKPCYVLAHSLGSVAAVDALIQFEDLNVAHLITIGSPAALFFEINALVSLPRTGKLPHHFPKWLNIFDPRDLLSYVAARTFRDDPRIQDCRHESGQPLLVAHSAYWASDRAWENIWKVIPSA